MAARIAFLLVTMLCLSAAPAAPRHARKKPVATCPAKREAVKPGAPCSLEADAVCSYGPSSWCACEPTSCVSAAGPIRDCESRLLWTCRDDGCPRQPRGACSTEGQRCDYDEGLCASTAVCRGGSWKSGAQNCRPAAPPRR